MQPARGEDFLLAETEALLAEALGTEPSAHVRAPLVRQAALPL
ncbi:MAG: hypothetical protein M0002_00635 [Rhodospirillales bacterium]|nr:hypothetical protein [Rhodospirillales bacterium]